MTGVLCTVYGAQVYFLMLNTNSIHITIQPKLYRRSAKGITDLIPHHILTRENKSTV